MNKICTILTVTVVLIALFGGEFLSISGQIILVINVVVGGFAIDILWMWLKKRFKEAKEYE